MEIYTISEILYYLKTMLEVDDRLSDTWLQGEVSNCKKYPSGHFYFDLKDEGGLLRCVMFKNSALRQKYLPQDGSTFVMHGFFDLYEGKLQFRVNEVLPGGLGRFHLEFEALKQKLELEGLFAPERKRALPLMPRVIGVVTSPAAAAFQDILKVLSRRYPLAQVILSPTQVQGVEAPAQIVRAIQALNTLENVDVIIVARGGGSIEDLWSFNHEQVARAIFASRIPVITGVGHETDTTIVDYVADVRAPTPSAAAELVAAVSVADLSATLEALTDVLHASIQHLLDEKSMALEDNQRRLTFSSPANRISQNLQQVQRLRERCNLHLDRILERNQLQVKVFAARLQALHPQRILERGYAILTREQDGSIISDVQAAQPGENLQVRLKDGTFNVTVK